MLSWHAGDPQRGNRAKQSQVNVYNPRLSSRGLVRCFVFLDAKAMRSVVSLWKAGEREAIYGRFGEDSKQFFLFSRKRILYLAWPSW